MLNAHPTPPSSPEREARAWLTWLDNQTSVDREGCEGCWRTVDVEMLSVQIANRVAHIRQQQKEQDARIAKTYADGGCSGDAIAAAIRSQP